MIHCADLNGSVIRVGRVARQFHDAVTQVRHLRKQVKEIQETLGARDSSAMTAANAAGAAAGGANAANASGAGANASSAAAAANKQMVSQRYIDVHFPRQAASIEIMQRQIGVAIAHGRSLDGRRPRRQVRVVCRSHGTTQILCAAGVSVRRRRLTGSLFVVRRQCRRFLRDDDDDKGRRFECTDPSTVIQRHVTKER